MTPLSQTLEQKLKLFDEKFPPQKRTRQHLINLSLALIDSQITWLEGQKRISDSSTYLYGQGQSNAFETTLSHLKSEREIIEKTI